MLPGTWSTLLNSGPLNGLLCLALNSGGKAFSLSPLSIMLALVFLFWMSIIGLRKFPFIPIRLRDYAMNRFQMPFLSLLK